MDSANNTPAVHEQTAEPYLEPHVWQEWTVGTWLQPFSDTREAPRAV